MGIDPGTSVMGYGIIKVTGKKLELLNMGNLILSKIPNLELRYKKIFDRTLMLIDEYHPDELGIEAPFFGKNVQSMLKLGRAQGVAIAACLHRDIPFTEYAPKKIKQAITGNGSASKEQVAAMIQTTLNIKSMPKDLDASDGVAAALTHYYSTSNPILKDANFKSWADFANKMKK